MHARDKEKSGLSVKQTFQILQRISEFKKSVVISVIGIIIVLIGTFFKESKIALFISVIGCLISYSGFDQISKIIVGIQNMQLNDYERIIRGEDPE